MDNNNHEISEPEEEDHDVITSSTIDESWPEFSHVAENIYLGDKKKRVNKEIRRMSCDCTYDSEEHDFSGCGEDCLNRLLLIECNSRCPCGEFCSNRKFQQGQKVRIEAFKTLKKGWGLRTLEDISAHQFVIEYCGEVMGYDEFESRVEMYDKENRRHYYFMTLRADEIIDATHKGNLSRFINHSCTPNCETQKWTVNGYLRIGFFSVKDIKAGTELTFDYKFQRYGKKAQVCYCESENCRGIIGGEKHTPLKSIISGRGASPAPTSSPRRNRRRRLAEQYDDKPLELEIAQLLAGEKGIKGDEEALKLSQFMVRAETQTQRLLLLDMIFATEDQNCLRSFVRYQGMSLLWSWMIDLGDNSLRLQKKIVQVLKHLPVANLNQVKDTKVLKVINKWARKPSVACIPEEETSSTSSDIDLQQLSPVEVLVEASKREAAISSSDMEYTTTVNVSKPKDIEITNLTSVDNTVEKPIVVETSDKCKEVDSVDEKNSAITDQDVPCVVRTIGDSSEEDSRWSEDDCTSTDSEDITDMAAELLDSWSNLKEVYRIPKKSTIVEKREPESTSGAVEAVEQSYNREIPKMTTIPRVDGDIFQEDEFLSKLGETMIENQQEVNLIPPLMGTTPQRPGEVDNDKPSIHQRLQMVAGSASGAGGKMYPIWYGKGSHKNRNHPYHVGADAFQPHPVDNWITRNPVAVPSSQFNQPTGHPSNQPVHPGIIIPNMAGNQWQAQQGMYPSGYQYAPGGDLRSPGFTGQVQQSQPYFSPATGGQNVDSGLYQAPYVSHNVRSSVAEQPSYGARQQEIQSQSMYSIPTFDPSKPPPNFVPSDIPQLSGTIHTQYNSTQFPNTPSMYATVPDTPNYPLQPARTQQTVSQKTPPYAMTEQATAMVSSTVCETDALDISAMVGNTDAWSVEPYNKPRDAVLPPDWKKAYDGEGRAYYYHVGTRQTQWEPPSADRSPPTPEVGYLGDELDSSMDISFSSQMTQDVAMEIVDPVQKKKPKTPSTPPGSPPKSPVTAAADTTIQDVRKGLYSPSLLLQGNHLTPEQVKRREAFRIKLSSVVVNYLNPYHKFDCKVGRITTVDDFKFLARKLTHGIMVKELSRLKDETILACNDSVKIKTKEYIRNYMQKFGAVYKAAQIITTV